MSGTETTYAGFFAEARQVIGCAVGVWRMIPRRQQVSFLSAGGLMAVVSGCNVAFPLLLGDLVDTAKAGVEGKDILAAALGILGLIAGLYALREFLQVVRRSFVEAACTKLERQLTVRVIGRTMRADLAALSTEKIGALQGRIGRSVLGAVRLVRLALLDFFPPLLTGVFAVVAALTKQPLLALVMLGVIPASLVLTARQLASQKGVRLRLMRGREQIDGAVVELFGGLDYIRAAHTEQHEVQRLEAASRDLQRQQRRHHFEMSIYGAVRALNEGLFHILVLGLGVYLATTGRITYGDILTVSMLFLSVMAPLNEVHRGLDEGHESALQVADLKALLNQPPCRSYSPPDCRPPALETDRPLLEAERLVVEYPTASGPKRALDDVSVCIRHGETIGFAGPSGCGKTTLLRVLLRLTHPSAGAVRVGGVNLESVSRRDIGGLIGYVGQNPFVFHGTVAENIAYGVSGATREAVEHAARRAHIHDEILAMPGGYEAAVTERGTNLSGGQRQRLALARIFLKDPPVLVLDESTSALDTISERHVKAAIDLARKDRTVLLVAHRLSTLKDADRILVFRDGRVVEEGRYDDLCVGDGVFGELVRSAEMTVPG
jgi:ATP-binding cassette, subfamily B, bacterial